MRRILFTMLFPIFILANEITISKFEPFESPSNPEMEEIIRAKVLSELKSNQYTIVQLNSTGKVALAESKSRGAKLHIGGYYKKLSKYPVEIYIQVYSTEKELVIDAISSGRTFDSQTGIEFAPDELKRLDDDKSSETARKLSTQLRLNSDFSEQPQNINDELLNKKIAKAIQFPVSQTGREKDVITRDTFQLMGSQEVETASRSKESILDAPATIMVITEEDIRQRGYTSITEIFSDIPGMDISNANGSPHLHTYMRGYRTDYGQKIMLMIDSKPLNDLWDQMPLISRQFSITSIKKIEILYGPSSVVYGPNATQGIVNIITKSGQELKKDGITSSISLQHGSFDTSAFDGTVTGKSGELSYTLSARYFKSDEPNLSGRKVDSYTNNFYYGFKPIWGPVLDNGVNGKKFGKYNDPSLDKSVHANLSYKGLKIGIFHDQIQEGFGSSYTGDQVQNNANWGWKNTQYYAEYDKMIGNKFRSFTQFMQRDHFRGGTWTEALPSPTEEAVYDVDGNQTNTISKPYESMISNTYWQTINKSNTINQIFEYKFNKVYKLNVGLNYNNRDLTRNYDVAGYYNAFSSVLPNDPDKYPDGYNVTTSSNATLPITPMPSERMHPSNSASIQDKGGYMLHTIDWDKFRFSAGIRYDKNSIYGSTVNPRMTAIYKHTPNQAWKIMYGEAFQEPTAIQVYGDSGGANYGALAVGGAIGNTNLKAEKLRSGELVWILQGKNFYNEVSSFYNRYDRVIEGTFQSVYGKRIYGTEWKLNVFFPNLIPGSSKISSYMSYSFTESLNSVTYDRNALKFSNGTTIAGKYEKYYNEYIYPETQLTLPRKREYFTQGDIAKNKFNIGFNVPILNVVNFNLRGSYIGKKNLYTTNPLRDQSITTDAYFIWNGTLTYLFETYGSLSLKVYNLFNQYYLHPGVEFAGGGNRYWERSMDYRSSILPQPGRYYLLNLTITF